MKNLLLIFLAVAVFSSCKQSSPDDNGRNVQLLNDSMVLHNNNIYTDTTASDENNAIPEPQTVKNNNTPGIKKSTPERRPVVHSTIPSVSQNKQKVETPVTPPVEEKTSGTTPPVANNSGSGNGTVQNGEGSVGGETGNIPAPEKKKKGWNNSTKGAVIGGAVGAVGGAIISKKKGVGAVVGAIAGAAGGYIIGKNKDKKDSTKK
jgi:hypothetical protein